MKILILIAGSMQLIRDLIYFISFFCHSTGRTFPYFLLGLRAGLVGNEVFVFVLAFSSTRQFGEDNINSFCEWLVYRSQAPLYAQAHDYYLD